MRTMTWLPSPRSKKALVSSSVPAEVEDLRPEEVDEPLEAPTADAGVENDVAVDIVETRREGTGKVEGENMHVDVVSEEER